MASEHPIAIDTLPPELLAHIFSYFDGPAPSDYRLHDQPDSAMLDGSPQDVNLKNISCVSKRWRAISLPLLFRHVVWYIDRHRLLVELADLQDPSSAIPLLSYLRANNLGGRVSSFTLLLGYRTVPAQPSLDSLAVSRFDPSPLVETDEDRNWLWNALFGLIDPRRLTIIASPQALADLLSRVTFLNDVESWSTTPPLHVLSLSRDLGSTSTPAQSSRPHYYHPPERPHPRSVLFTIRPWTHLLLNEGSFIRLYRTYEFFLRRPPSILGALLDNKRVRGTISLMPPTVTSFSYVAIFPHAGHFVSLIHDLPRLERLFVQLAPRNDVLQNWEEMRNVYPADLWMERDSCYHMIMEVMLHPLTSGAAAGDPVSGDHDDSDSDGHVGKARNWRFLREIETGDVADKEAWDAAVSVLNRSQASIAPGQLAWSIEREGLLVKRPKPVIRESETPDSDSSEEDDDILSALSAAISPW
ncbi:hypothetical protein VTK26DRAFT_8093 [Humicola hyalothermophila]